MNNQNKSCMGLFLHTLQNRPSAAAKIKGSDEFSDINGIVKLYQTAKGALVLAEIFGLPCSDNCFENSVHGFHIHGGKCCCGNEDDPFADADGHYNPCDSEHPYHAGDLPPLFSNNGYAFTAFLTNRFKVKDVIGKTIIIHSNADDFTTQPSGNSGKKIACGEIESLCR